MPRLDRAAFERWLASPEAAACVHRRGRPGGDERPLIAEAARRFGVDRRTIERAIARLVRRQRLLAEHQPVDAALAGLLLDAAKSFVVGNNTTTEQLKMRQSSEQGSRFLLQQRLAAAAPPPPPDPLRVLEAMRILVRAGVVQAQDVQGLVARELDGRRASDAVQLAAVGLRDQSESTAKATSRPTDPARLSREALLDAVDAFQAQSTAIPPAVQAHLDAIRQALGPGGQD